MEKLDALKCKFGLHNIDFLPSSKPREYRNGRPILRKYESVCTKCWKVLSD